MKYYFNSQRQAHSESHYMTPKLLKLCYSFLFTWRADFLTVGFLREDFLIF